MSEWISVKDRLPTKMQLCVYWIKKPNMDISSGFPDSGFYFDNGFERESDFGEITHWMPLKRPSEPLS